MERKLLDLNRVDLYGWETVKNYDVIDSIVRGIEKGDKFPPVEVSIIDETTYEFPYYLKNGDYNLEGGHRRAVGHYIAGVPLEVEVIKQGGLNRKHNIKDTLLLFDNSDWRIQSYDFVKLADPKYR